MLPVRQRWLIAVPTPTLLFQRLLNLFLVYAQDKERSVPLSALEDTRCDVCLFFVAPHSSLDALKATLRAS